MSEIELPRKYFIKISDDALMEMSLATLEGYVVQQVGRRKNEVKKEVETYGFLWGNEIRLPDRNILFSIRKMTVDAMAYRQAKTVAPSEFREIAKDLVTSYWADYSFLGDFHSHPYEHTSEVERDKGYEFSDGDREFMLEMKKSDYDYKVAIVMTVASLKKSMNMKPKKIINKIITWDFNNYRFWLNACVVLGGKENSINSDESSLNSIFIFPKSTHWKRTDEVNNVGEVVLHCASLESLIKATEFGRKISKGEHGLGIT